jgi:chemotaxis protein histidine kinase CheA
MNQENPDGFFSEEEMDTLKRIALEELRELCDSLEQSVAALRADPGDQDARRQALHIFHTIGGSAAMAGFKDISAIGISMETALKKHDGAAVDRDLLEQIGGAFNRLDADIGAAENAAD